MNPIADLLNQWKLKVQAQQAKRDFFQAHGLDVEALARNKTVAVIEAMILELEVAIDLDG